MAIKKKWSEKGKRAEFFGSNPHSNGLFFSRSIKVFLEIIFDSIITIIERISKKLIIILKIIIIYTNNLDLLIGNQL